MAQPLVNSPCWFPLTTPLTPECLLLTWNPSSLRGAILVHPGPRLHVNWPPPPHSIFPPPNGSPNSIVRPLKTTLRHRLHIVRNTYSSLPLLIDSNSKPGSFIGQRWSRWSWARCYSSHLNFLFGLTQCHWKTRPNLQPQIWGKTFCLYLSPTNHMKLSFKK